MTLEQVVKLTSQVASRVWLSRTRDFSAAKNELDVCGMCLFR